MASIKQLLSQQSKGNTASEDETEPDVLSIDDEEADAVFSALSSHTTRSILAHLYENPLTATGIADAVDTSIQNVNYHLQKLDDGGLIQVVETTYSDQGKEMKIYGPTNKALVIFASDEAHRPSLVDMLKRLFGFIGIFALLSFLVDRGVRQLLIQGSSRSTPSAGSSSNPTAGHSLIASSPIPPGLLFFSGAALALLSISLWWYYHQ